LPIISQFQIESPPIFQRASTFGYFKGIAYRNGEYLSHLQYIDDTLIFISNDYNSLTHAKGIMRWFELASGL
jgi:hypothetical protein